jgi:uncharacterized membrane protein YraQ (UPF0718 family)
MSSRAEHGNGRRGGWWFMLAVLGGYGLLLPFEPALVKDAVSHFLQLLKILAPVLAAVLLLLWLINLLVDPRRIRHSLGRDSGARGWAIAILGGILSHGPVYAWYPLLTDLQRHGTRPTLLATFLYARSIKLPWLPMLAYYFGTGYMLLLTLFLTLFSPLVGLATGYFCCREGEREH